MSAEQPSSNGPKGDNFAIDESRWPLLMVRTWGKPDISEFKTYLSHMEAYRRRGESYGGVFDIRELEHLSPSHRKLQIESLKRDRPRLKMHAKAAAYVVDSAIKQGWLTAIFWVMRPVCPTKVFTNPYQAVAWVERELARHGLSAAAQ